MTEAILPLSPLSAAGTNPSAPQAAAPSSFSFGDLLSVLNPLQHIPVVGTIYRAITGDVIHPAARILGGALFGGPIGLVTSIANAMFEQITGKDVGDQALALLDLSSDKSPPVPAGANSNIAAGNADTAKPAPAAQLASAAAEDIPEDRPNAIRWLTERQQVQAAPAELAAAGPAPSGKIEWSSGRQFAKLEIAPDIVPPTLNPIAAGGRPMTPTVPLKLGMDPATVATQAQLQVANMRGASGATPPASRGVPLAYQPKPNLVAAARFAPPVPMPPAEIKPTILTPANGPVAVAAPIAPAAPAPGPWFVDAMAKGLERYGDVARPPAGAKVDLIR